MRRKDELTSRQVEIMELVKLGYGNKQVAAKMGVTIQTVKNHLSVILRKLDALNRAHAVYLLLKRGIIE